MLNKFEIPKEVATTKQERLQQVAEQVIDNIPTTYRMLMRPYLHSFLQALASSETTEHIDKALDATRDVIDYVQHGYHPGE